MAAFLTFAVWFSALGVVWWLWASAIGPSEPAGSVVNAVFVLLGLFLVWYLLFSPVPDFLHFGPHHPHGLLGLDSGN